MDEYMDLNYNLYKLINEGKGSSAEANNIRDWMESIFATMTEKQQAEIKILSENLWEEMK